MRDLAENWTAPKADSPSPFHAELTGEKISWQQINTAESKIPPKLELVQAKAEAEPTAEKNNPQAMLQSLLALKPEALGPGMQQAQQATRDFVAGGETDKSGYETKLNEAIAQSDRDYGDTVAAKWGDLSLARREVTTKIVDFVEQNQKLVASVRSLPENEQAPVKAMIALLDQKQISPELRNSIHKELSHYPQVADSVNTTIKAKEAVEKAGETLVKAQEPLFKAASEQALSRLLLANLKELNGDAGGAYILKQKAQESYANTAATIQGKPIEVKPGIEV